MSFLGDDKVCAWSEVVERNGTGIGPGNGPERDNTPGDGGFSGEDKQIKFFFDDNGAENNFYMTGFETSITVFPEYFVFDDEFTQGQQNFGLYISEDLEAGDQMVFSLYGISERYMNYMNVLIEVSQGGGGPWGAPPTNVRGNLVNQTDADNFALGYFRLSEVDKMDYVVQ